MDGTVGCSIHEWGHKKKELVNRQRLRLKCGISTIYKRFSFITIANRSILATNQIEINNEERRGFRNSLSIRSRLIFRHINFPRRVYTHFHSTLPSSYFPRINLFQLIEVWKALWLHNWVHYHQLSLAYKFQRFIFNSFTLKRTTLCKG